MPEVGRCRPVSELILICVLLRAVESGVAKSCYGIGEKSKINQSELCK